MSKKQPNSLFNIFKGGSNLTEKEIADKISKLYKEGLEYLKNKDIDKAEESFSQILEFDSGHLESLLQLAKVYIQKGSYKESIVLLKKYLNEEPNSFEAKFRISTAYIKVKDFELAIGILNQLRNSQTDPKKAAKVTATLIKGYYSEAKYFKENKKFKEAIASYEQVSKFENDDEKNLFYVGLCYKEAQKYPKAIEVLNSALKVKKEKKEYTSDIYLNLGDIEELQGNNGRAIRMYQNFIEQNPDSPDKHLFYGKIHSLQKNVEKAIESFNKALTTEKYQSETYSELAKAYLIQKNYDEALKAYQEVLKTDKNNYEVLLNTVILRIKLSDIAKAFETLNKLDEKIFKQKPEITKELGKALFELGMLDEAIKKLHIAKTVLSEDPEIPIYLRQCYAKSGNIEEAEKEMQKAIKLAPNNFTVLKELVQIHKENNDFEKALEVCTKMISIDSREKEPLKLIAGLHMENKHFKEAITYYQDYLSTIKNDVDAIYNLSICYFELIQMNSAIKEFVKLHDDHKYGFMACSFLTNIYISKGDMNKALEFVEKCIQYSPNYAEGYIKYGKICAHIGKIDRALKYFKYAETIDPGNSEASNLSQYYLTYKH